jgi:hypothetical protein
VPVARPLLSLSESMKKKTRRRIKRATKTARENWKRAVGPLGVTTSALTLGGFAVVAAFDPTTRERAQALAGATRELFHPPRERRPTPAEWRAGRRHRAWSREAIGLAARLLELFAAESAQGASFAGKTHEQIVKQVPSLARLEGSALALATVLGLSRH